MAELPTAATNPMKTYTEAEANALITAAYEAAALAMEPYVRNEDQRIRDGQRSIRALTTAEARTALDGMLAEAYESGVADVNAEIRGGTITSQPLIKLLFQAQAEGAAEEREAIALFCEARAAVCDDNVQSGFVRVGAWAGPELRDLAGAIRARGKVVK